MNYIILDHRVHLYIDHMSSQAAIKLCNYHFIVQQFIIQSLEESATLTGAVRVEIHQREVIKCVLAAVFMQLEAFHPKLCFMSVGGILTRAFPKVHNINTKKISCFFLPVLPFISISPSPSVL